MLLHHEHLWLKAVCPHLLVDEDRPLAEGTEILVETRSLAFVLCVLDLMSQPQIKDQRGECCVLDKLHKFLCLEVEHQFWHASFAFTQVVRKLELELILLPCLLHLIN